MFGILSLIYRQFAACNKSVAIILSSFLFFKQLFYGSGRNSAILFPLRNNSPISGQVISSELYLLSIRIHRISTSGLSVEKLNVLWFIILKFWKETGPNTVLMTELN